MIDSEIEMKELGRKRPGKYSQHKIVDPYLSSMSIPSSSRKKPSRWKDRITHTHAMI